MPGRNLGRDPILVDPLIVEHETVYNGSLGLRLPPEPEVLMLKDFDAVKGQLKELAEVVNAFKSEAVQLRIVELVLSVPEREDGDPDAQPTPDHARRSPARRRAAKPENGNENGERMGSRRSGGRGARATLSKAMTAGYFKKPHTLGELVQHAETNMASKFKQSDFSGSLARYVRDGKLKRVKNSEGQYEYSEA